MCLFNFCCLNIVPSRWLMRSAYNIPGDEMNDCILAAACPCCVVNQMIQTSLKYGNPTLTRGHFFNTNPWANNRGCECVSASNTNLLCYSLCCLPCSVGSTLEVALGMPFVIGCCCVNPFTARNLIRYQYRIKGDDVLEVLPLTLYIPLLCQMILLSLRIG